jgi:CheY-like chemotaxis protein
MPNEAQAFLSYTRVDDEFFGGAITSLRKSLELGVRVITGDKNFRIFQDIDGISLGQQWQKRLDEAITQANFLIPVLTPCFFNSSACLDELGKFLVHEKTLGRDDLILPIYYVTFPVFEREGSEVLDPIATNISRIAKELKKRQLYDWREKTELPITDLQIRRAIRDLAEKIASAITRAGTKIYNNPAAEKRRTADFINVTEAVAREKLRAVPRKKTPARKLILWVDDRPHNNIFERDAFAAYNIDFVLAETTEHAIRELIKQPREHFDAIISDMGRPPDPRAGYTLLEMVRALGYQIPFFIYAGSRAPEHIEEAHRRGAQGTTNMPSELIAMVIKQIEDA